MQTIIAIDPGINGGIATLDEDGIVRAIPMPDGMTSIIDTLRNERAQLGPSVRAVIENVGQYRPGNSGPSAVNFARHVGNIESALYCLCIPTEKVTPQKWQKSLATFSKEHDERKKQIKELMARRHPDLTVTLKTADALGILAWAMKGTK